MAEQKKMTTVGIVISTFFAILFIPFAIIVAYYLIHFLLGNHTFTDGKFHGFTILAKYKPWIGAAMLFGAVGFIIDSFKELIKFIKNKNK